MNSSNSDAYLNTEMFLSAALRLSETKMRVRRHADGNPAILQQADRLKETVDEVWRRDEDQFMNQLF